MHIWYVLVYLVVALVVALIAALQPCSNDEEQLGLSLTGVLMGLGWPVVIFWCAVYYLARLIKGTY